MTTNKVSVELFNNIQEQLYSLIKGCKRDIDELDLEQLKEDYPSIEIKRSEMGSYAYIAVNRSKEECKRVRLIRDQCEIIRESAINLNYMTTDDYIERKLGLVRYQALDIRIKCSELRWTNQIISLGLCDRTNGNTQLLAYIKIIMDGTGSPPSVEEFFNHIRAITTTFKYSTEGKPASVDIDTKKAILYGKVLNHLYEIDDNLIFKREELISMIQDHLSKFRAQEIEVVEAELDACRLSLERIEADINRKKNGNFFTRLFK